MAKRAALSTAVWFGVFLLAELVIDLVVALSGADDHNDQTQGTIVIGACFIASVNHHRRVQRRRRANAA